MITRSSLRNACKNVFKYIGFLFVPIFAGIAVGTAIDLVLDETPTPDIDVYDGENETFWLTMVGENLIVASTALITRRLMERKIIEKKESCIPTCKEWGCGADKKNTAKRFSKLNVVPVLLGVAGGTIVSAALEYGKDSSVQDHHLWDGPNGSLLVGGVIENTAASALAIGGRFLVDKCRCWRTEGDYIRSHTNIQFLEGEADDKTATEETSLLPKNAVA